MQIILNSISFLEFIHQWSSLILPTPRGLVMLSRHLSCCKVSAMRKFTVQRANLKIALPRAFRFASSTIYFSAFFPGDALTFGRDSYCSGSHRECKQKRRRKRKRATQSWKRGQRPLIKIGIRVRLNANKVQANSLRRYSINRQSNIMSAQNQIRR